MAPKLGEVGVGSMHEPPDLSQEVTLPLRQGVDVGVHPRIGFPPLP